MKNDVILKDLMSVAVFLTIEQIRRRGGPSEEDMKKAQETSAILGEHGDILSCGGGKKGEIADLFNEVAHAISVLAFVPGGIRIFGMTFDAAEQLKSIRWKGQNDEGTQSKEVDGNETG